MANTPATISLEGWDTANVASFDVINAAIKSQGKTPMTFSFVSGDPNSQPSVSGNWDAWSLDVGGSGQTIQVKCPVKNGSAIFASPMNTMPGLNGSSAGASLTLDPTRLIVTNSATAGAVQSILGDVGRASGKYYFEVTVGKASAGGEIIGFAPSGAAGQAFAAATPGAYGYRSDGQAISGGAPMAFPGGAAKTWTAGDTVGVAIDLGAGKIWFRAPDGKWQGAAGADPVTGTSPAFTYTPSATTLMYPAVALGAGGSLTANFGQMVLKNPPPGGFTIIGSVFTVLPLDGFIVKAQISLTDVRVTGSKTALMADSTSTPASPAVMMIGLVPPTTSTATPQQIKQAQLTFDNVLNNDIASFKNVFHTFDANSALAKGKLAWLNPTDTQYAVADAASTPSTATSVFALLSMTENRDDSTLTPQIAPAILDYKPTLPNPNMPITANSVFALSAERFTAKILLGVATATLVGSTASDFAYDSTGLVISNVNDLPWREINLDDGSKVTPMVPAGGFKIRTFDRYIELEFKGAHFDVPGWPWPGHKIATLEFKQQVFLKLAEGTDAQGRTIHYLLARNVDPDSTNAQAIADDLPTIIDPVVNVGFDQTAINFQTAMEAVAIVLSVLTIGLAGFSVARWVIRSQQLQQAAANAVQVGNGAIQLQAFPIYGQTSLAQAAAVAAPAAVQGGGAVVAGGVLFVTKVAIGTTVATVFAGLVTAAFWTIWGVSTAKDLADGITANLPADFTVEALLTEAFQAYDWTGTANNWKVVDARLAKSLLIYGELT
ncbi:TULIP family P47-like protein [Bradyrhizobium manausense]|uniref:TULIP family P47-like protein n=1 Tax=Bradyrhizobium manausense TaxID=989370 RepID=UPI001BAB3F9F|nr:TULIP family P47-like protein [Bradyrhizobium manausense]MBR0828483.1 TULIP family P47-like protein [Bradyrhizobium manausense]